MSGLKSLAQELPRYGRYGDSIVAHINPQEAALLKALGGSGTINPHTGLPEYWGGLGALNPFNPGSTVGKIVQQVPGVKETQNLATQVFQPIEKAVVQPVSNALVNVDKAVGKAIPGGWGTVGMVAASMIPGMTPAMMAGLGAINGSGVLRRGGNFNLQGAMMGGAMAYGMASLGEYARGAMPTDVTPTVNPSTGALTNPPPSVLPGELGDIPVTTPSAGAQPQINYSAAPGTGGYSQSIASGAVPSNVPTNVVTPTGSEIEAIRATQPGLMERVGNYVADIPSSVSQSVGQTAREMGTSISNAADKYTTPSTYTEAAKAYGENVSRTGEGIKNLITGAPGASATAASNAAAQGITSPLMATGATLYGATGLMALEEQRKYLEQQKAANAITQAEYDNALAEINRSEAVARRAVADNPFNVNPDRTPTPTGTDYRKYGAEENLYERLTGEKREYKKGGEVKHYLAGSLVSADGTSTPTMDFMALQQYMQNAPVPANQTIYEQPIKKMIYDQPAAQVVTSNLPQGIIAPPANAITTQALGSFYNPVTGEEVTVPSGGYTATPESGFFAGSNPKLGPTLYRRNKKDERLYAVGGSIDDETGLDEARGLSPGNMQNGFMNSGGMSTYYDGGMIPNYQSNLNGIQSLASGGQPRFLSGGGDGMSDSIPATIGGKQEARLADGEFVVPADVVSHLGNGSSKAGAKQLYSMMDKVRRARTGTVKQGKQINPRKFLPA